jgi:uncharacterized protein with von Willebrand factor type A (vWA) domain
VLIDFFLSLKASGLPVSVKEYLTLCEAMQRGLAYGNVDDFYYLSRICLIKDEANYDVLTAPLPNTSRVSKTSIPR